MTRHSRVGLALGCIVLTAACSDNDAAGSPTTDALATTDEPTRPADPAPSTSDGTPTDPGTTTSASTSATDTTGTSAASTSGDTSGPAVGDASCGNGLVDAGEACDLGDNNVPDGIPVEYGCGDHCQTWLYCGDGVVQEPHEDCDVKDSQGFCTESCQDIYLIFLTGDKFTGNLGGVAGADEKCTAAGAARVPNGVFKAWLLGPGDTLETRFGMFYPPPQAPEDAISFSGADKQPLADSFQELAAVVLGKVGLPKHPIVRTEAYTTDGMGCPEDLCSQVLVWSNIDDAGNESGTSCAGWTTGNGKGTVGINSVLPAKEQEWIDKRMWTSFLMEKQDCRGEFRLYCIQVGFKDE